VLTANERLDYVAALTIVGQVVFMIFGALFLFNGLGFVWLVVASVISILPRIGLAVWVIKRYHLATLPFQIHPSSWLGLIRAGLPFGMISLALTIGFRIDTVLLSKFQPDYVVGWYNLAYSLERSVLYFFASFSIAIVPSLTRAYVQDTSAVKRWYYRSVKYIALTALPLAVGGMLVAEPLIRSLYTDEFLPAVPSLRIIIWDIPFLMFSSFCGNITTAVSEERAAARIYIISAVVNILLNLYAIPRFSLIGASVVTVITDLVATLQFYILLRGKLDLPNMTSVFVRVLIASVFMGIAIILAGERHLFLLIGLGIGVYGGLALALQLLDKEEWSMILRLLRRRRDPQPVGPTTEF
jgi:O-antigen/teichoic acid export membrane protein